MAQAQSEAIVASVGFAQISLKTSLVILVEAGEALVEEIPITEVLI